MDVPPTDDEEQGDSKETVWHGVWVKRKRPRRKVKHLFLRYLTDHLLGVFENKDGNVFKQRAEVQSPAKSQYEESLDLVESLPYVAKRRVSKYLMGYSGPKIAHEEYCTKQAVSKIISPLFFIWDWDREHRKKLRLEGEYNTYLVHLHRMVGEDTRTKAHFGNLDEEDIGSLHELISRFTGEG